MDDRPSPGKACDVLPNFFLVGGKKCGTTSLYSKLGDHPAIAFPYKEIHYFTYAGLAPELARKLPATVVTSEDAYHRLFAPLADTPVRGDASPSYLTDREAAGRIRDAVPEAKVVAVLRHPVDRMFSDYLHERRAGREPAETFEEALAHDGQPGRQDYRWKSTYVPHIERWRSLYPDDQLCFLVYDDYVADPVRFLQGIFAFLGIDADYVPTNAERWTRRGGVARSQMVSRATRAPALRSAARTLLPARLRARAARSIYKANTVRPAIAPETRARLLADTRDDVAGVEALLDRDLSAWRT